MYDVVIVGAGFAGSVLARQLASESRKKVLLIEKRNHIGGNCYDYYDENGVIVHKYGPHLFHTSNKRVFDYLGQFTEWHEYEHRVRAFVDCKTIPIPFNLNSLYLTFPKQKAEELENKLVDQFGFGVKVPIFELIKAEDQELKELADFIYDKVFVNYTMKQWGCGPEDISPEVMQRVPVSISHDDRYFQDTFQAVPKYGYTKLFENMLDQPGVEIKLNCDYKKIISIDLENNIVHLCGERFEGDLIFTGMLDEFFGFCFGKLPYRTLDFAFERLDQEYFQEVAVVNYPNDFDFTRITEFKWIHGQKRDNTTILREYPRDYKGADKEEDTPSYPIFKDENMVQYDKYFQLAQQFPQITLVGRLAEYRYYDMDDIVERALEVYDQKFS